MIGLTCIWPARILHIWCVLWRVLVTLSGCCWISPCYSYFPPPPLPALATGRKYWVGQRFIQVFLEDVMEKPEWTLGPTQYNPYSTIPNSNCLRMLMTKIQPKLTCHLSPHTCSSSRGSSWWNASFLPSYPTQSLPSTLLSKETPLLTASSF